MGKCRGWAFKVVRVLPIFFVCVMNGESVASCTISCELFVLYLTVAFYHMDCCVMCMCACARVCMHVCVCMFV